MVKPKIAVCVALGLCLGLWLAPVQAAKTFSVAQTSPTPLPGQFDMGATPQPVTLSVTNTSTGGDVNQEIFQVQFQLPTTCAAPCTLTTFSSTTTAPAGWTRTALSSSSVTFRANSFSTALAVNQSASFTLALNVGTFTADTSQMLSKITARFSNKTNFSGAKNINCTNPNNCGGAAQGALGSWKAVSLQITSFLTVDATTGAPLSAVAAGSSFKLVITVKNTSTATQGNIVASPSPPTATKSGTWTPTTPNCSLTGTSPSPLTLAPGASGAITYTCTTVSTNSGTVFFTASVRNGANTATSRTAISNTLAVSAFVAKLNVSSSCSYLGQNFTVSMDLINNLSYGISGISATLSPTVSGIVTLVSGPTSTVSIGANTTLPNAFQWTYTVSGGSAGDLFNFNGSASGTANPPGSGTVTTPTSTLTSPVKRGGFNPVITSPVDGSGAPATNASSNNIELAVHIVNNGCAALQSLSIGLPSSAWPYNGDSYIVLNGSDDSWTAQQTGTAVGFAPPPPGTDLLAIGGYADFYVVLSSPAATGSYNFDFTFNDAGGNSSIRSLPVVVNSFNSGSPNPNATNTNSGTWREQFH